MHNSVDAINFSLLVSRIRVERAPGTLQPRPKIIEITAGMEADEIMTLLLSIGRKCKFKHHVFKERGTIDLVFEEVEDEF